jgi:orotidine-5'-phosphate decarboxylase
MTVAAKDKIILALDLEDLDELGAIVDPLRGELKWVKVGLQLFTRYGPDVVKYFADKGFSVFLDLKLHDIPNTVASAVKSLRDLPIGMLTIHTCGGSEMIQAAVNAGKEINPDLLILGVTVLTSMNEEALRGVGVPKTPLNQVQDLAKMAVESGLNGLVCSPLEVAALRKIIPEQVALVTPGIRPAGAATQDQKRIMTPAEAIETGSSWLVIGRPILKAQEPLQAFRDIVKEIS